MKVRILVAPEGYVSLEGQPLAAWPPVGAVAELPDVVAADLIASGRAEKASEWTGAEWLWPWRRPPAEPVGPTELKVRIKVQPTGYISLAGGPLAEWPQAGAVVELPNRIAEGLIAGGFAEVAVDQSPKAVRLKVKRSWPKVGAVVELPEAIAQHLIAGGLADELNDEVTH